MVWHSWLVGSKVSFSFYNPGLQSKVWHRPHGNDGYGVFPPENQTFWKQVPEWKKFTVYSVPVLAGKQKWWHHHTFTIIMWPETWRSQWASSTNINYCTIGFIQALQWWPALWLLNLLAFKSIGDTYGIAHMWWLKTHFELQLEQRTPEDIRWETQKSLVLGVPSDNEWRTRDRRMLDGYSCRKANVVWRNYQSTSLYFAGL